MSVTIHHSIVVTGHASEKVVEAYHFAKQLFGPFITNIVMAINGEQTFCITPDGSNDGWEKSRMYDDYRIKVVAKLRELRLWFVEIEFGENGTKIINSIPEVFHEKKESQETQH